MAYFSYLFEISQLIFSIKFIVYTFKISYVLTKRQYIYIISLYKSKLWGDMMSLQFRLIEIMCTIVRLGSFSKASEELYISQPALSQYIQRAEHELGYPLFIRDKGRCSPTEPGKILAKKGSLILSYRDELLRDMSAAAAQRSETVRLGMANGYTRNYLSDTIEAVYQSDPQIHIVPVEEHTVKLIEMLREHRVDLILCPLPPEIPGAVSRPLRREEMYVTIPKDCVSHEFFVDENGEMLVDLSKMADVPFVLVKDAPRFSDFCDQFFREAGISPKIVFAPDNWDTCDAMTSANVGATIVPDIEMKNSHNGNQYYRIKSQYPTYRIMTITYLQDQSLSEAGREVIAQIERVFGDDLAGRSLDELGYPMEAHGN